jgi:hypothetical protein
VTVTKPAPDVLDVDAGVIDDARVRQRRQRRRGAIVLLVFVLLGVAAAISVLAVSGSSSPATAASGSDAGGLPIGALATLHVAGPLAVGPNGALYVVDVVRDRILVSLADGHFRVVAGNGKVGFAGDGGPALDAELAGVSDLAFSASGSLYIADGGRVRVIGHDGVIHTIAGNGRAARTVTTGIPALTASLGASGTPAANENPLSIALGAKGQLYITTGGSRSADSQLLRLTAAGTLATVPDLVASGPFRGQHLNSLGPIAIDGHGDIDVAGFNGWSIWQVAPYGVAHEVGSGSGARRSGGNYSVLERTLGGTVYAEDGSTLLRIAGVRLIPVLSLTKVRGTYFWLTYFAFGRHGALYADEIPGGGGFEAHQQLVSVRGSRVSLLWQEKNAKPN